MFRSESRTAKKIAAHANPNVPIVIDINILRVVLNPVGMLSDVIANIKQDEVQTPLCAILQKGVSKAYVDLILDFIREGMEGFNTVGILVCILVSSSMSSPHKIQIKCCNSIIVTRA